MVFNGVMSACMRCEHFFLPNKLWTQFCRNVFTLWTLWTCPRPTLSTCWSSSDSDTGASLCWWLMCECLHQGKSPSSLKTLNLTGFSVSLFFAVRGEEFPENILQATEHLKTVSIIPAIGELTLECSWRGFLISFFNYFSFHIILHI